MVLKVFFYWVSQRFGHFSAVFGGFGKIKEFIMT